MKCKIILSSILILLCSGCSNYNNDVYQGYVEGTYTYISPAISGKVQKIAVNKGDQVQKNDLLFILDQQPEKDALQEAKNKLAAAKEQLRDIQKGKRPDEINALKAQRAQVEASLQYNKKTLARYRKLKEKGAIDKASVDAVYAQYQQDLRKIQEIDSNLAEATLGARTNQILAQQATVAAAKDAVKQALWQLQQKTKLSPVTGQVFDTYYGRGEFVAAGQPTVSILAPANIKLVFFIPETKLAATKVGQKITFHCDGCKKAYPATINFISSKAEYTPPVIYSEDSRTKLVYKIEAKIAPDIAAKMHVGQPVDVKFSTNKI